MFIGICVQHSEKEIKLDFLYVRHTNFYGRIRPSCLNSIFNVLLSAREDTIMEPTVRTYAYTAAWPQRMDQAAQAIYVLYIYFYAGRA